MHSQICKVQQEFKDDVESPGLTIHICVLQHGFSLQKNLAVPPDAKLSPDKFQLDHVVSRSELLSSDNLNGWDIHRCPAE